MAPLPRVWTVKKAIAIAASALVLLGTSPALAVTKATGQHGEYITASSTKISSGAKITVTGKNFDETVGIYLGFCVVPKKGQLPSPCGGGINKEGIGGASYWISSNPPPYGVGLAKPYLPGGRFTYVISATKKFGKVDCSKVVCAITVRADHLNSNDRSYDLFIPVTFRK